MIFLRAFEMEILGQAESSDFGDGSQQLPVEQ